MLSPGHANQVESITGHCTALRTVSMQHLVVYSLATMSIKICRARSSSTTLERLW